MKRKFSSFEFDKKEFETIPSKVCRILREAILKGEIKPGERLIQDELANLIGVSRMPIREAIRQLETEGLVIIEPHRGAIVKSFSLEEIEEVYYLRSLFEKEAVKESVKYIPETIIHQLEELIKKMEDTQDINEFVKINIEFHHLLMSYCPWKKLREFISSLWRGFPQQTPHMLPEQIDQSNREHRLIMAAVKEKDELKAGELISAHIERAGKAIIKSIKEDSK